MFGVKLVWGVYMEKECDWVSNLGYIFFIYLNKVVMDDVFNVVVRFCVDNYKDIVFCNVFYN